MMLQEELKWKQRLRNKWLQVGDHNTKFSRAIGGGRHCIIRINTIFSGGRVWESRDDIEREIIQFFRQLHAGVNWSRPHVDGIPFRSLS